MLSRIYTPSRNDQELFNPREFKTKFRWRSTIFRLFITRNRDCSDIGANLEARFPGEIRRSSLGGSRYPDRRGHIRSRRHRSPIQKQSLASLGSLPRRKSGSVLSGRNSWIRSNRNRIYGDNPRRSRFRGLCRCTSPRLAGRSIPDHGFWNITFYFYPKLDFVKVTANSDFIVRMNP